MSGKLFIVATPIGNLKDISQRALETLQEVDVIACEDTRHSQNLLSHFNIKKPLVPLHQHNETKSAHQLIERIQAGIDVAVISDAGTPVISDPGATITQLAHENDIQVIPIPGASAVMAALSASGFAGEQFIFAGFIPAKSGAKSTFLKSYEETQLTTVFYETPHRIADTLKVFPETYAGDRQIVIAREISKTFEQIVSLKISEAVAWLASSPNHMKGEFVILLEGNQQTQESKIPWQDLAQDLLALGVSTKDCARLLAKYTNEKKKTIYQALINLDRSDV